MRNALLVLFMLGAGYGGYLKYQRVHRPGLTVSPEQIEQTASVANLRQSYGEADTGEDSAGNEVMRWNDGALMAVVKPGESVPRQIVANSKFDGDLAGVRIGAACDKLPQFVVEDGRSHGQGWSHAALQGGDPEIRWALLWSETADHKVNSIILAQEERYGYCPKGPLYKSR